MGAQFIGIVFIVLGVLALVLLLQSLAQRPSVQVLLVTALLLVAPFLVQVWLA